MGFEVGVGEAARLAAASLVAASLDSVGSQRDDPAAR
jgi:hypothetical protein